MNFKRAISFAFLWIANVSILAHVVFFHHHESQLSAAICAENHKHQCSESAHPCSESDSASKCCPFENCLMSDFVSKVVDFKLTEPLFEQIDLILNRNLTGHTFDFFDLTGLPFRQKPYLPLYNSHVFSQSHGLRAPPVC